MAETFANKADSTLNGSITNVATSLTIQTADVAKFPQTGTFRILLTDATNYELCTVTGGQGTATWTVTRASEPYAGVQTAYAFASGSRVIHVFTQGSVAGLVGNASGAGGKLLLDYTAPSDLAAGQSLTADTWTNLGPAHSVTIDDPNALIQVLPRLAGFMRGSTSAAGVRLQVDGTINKILGGTGDSYRYAGNVADGAFIGASLPVIVGPLSAGAHTFQIQVISRGAGTTFFCRPSSVPTTETYNLQILQIPTVMTPANTVPGSKILLNYSASGTNTLGSVSSQTWTDLPGTSQSFVVDDPTAIVELAVSGSVEASATTAYEVAVRAVIDGTTTKTIAGNTTPPSNPSWVNILAGSSPVSFTGLSVGSHTVKLQVYGQGTLTSVTVTNTTYPNIYALNMVVTQKPQAQSTTSFLPSGDKILLDYNSGIAADLMANTTLTNNVWTDVTGTSLTFIVTDPTALININFLGFLNLDSGTGGYKRLRLVTDGDTANATIVTTQFSQDYTNALPLSITIGPLSAGSHTIKLQALSTATGGRVWLRPLSDGVPFLVKVIQKPQQVFTGTYPVANGNKLLLNFEATTDLVNGGAVSANTWTDTPGTSQSFNVDDPNAIIRIEAGGMIQLYNPAADNVAGARLVIDGNIIKSIGGGIVYAGKGMNILAGASPVEISGLSVGPHTVKLQVNSGAALSQYCLPATDSRYSFSLRVIQQPAVYSAPVGGSAGDKVLLNWNASSTLANGAALSATTWTDIPGTSQTFVVDDPDAIVEISVSGKVMVFTNSQSTNVGTRMVVDTTNYNLGGTYCGTAGGVTGNQTGNALSGVSPYSLTGLSVGQHTIKLQVYAQNASTYYAGDSSLEATYSLGVRVLQRPKVYRGGSVPAAVATRTATQAISASTPTAITFTAEESDTDSIFDLSAATRMTIRTPGKYVVIGHAEFSITGAFVYIRKNGVATDLGISGGTQLGNALYMGDFIPTDYVELFVSGPSGFNASNARLQLFKIGDVGQGGPIKYAEVVLTGTAASVTLPVIGTIPANYRTARIVWEGRTDAAVANTNVKMQLNGDTGTNYHTQLWESYGSGANNGNSELRSQSFIRIGYLAGASDTAGTSGGGEVKLIGYSGTTFRKKVSIQSLLESSTNIDAVTGGGTWTSTAAITSVTIFPNSGNFVAGSTFTLYLEP